MADGLATVAVLKDLTTAKFYQSLLEENGVPAFVPDEFVAALKNPKFWVAIGDIHVQVPPERAPEAVEVLQDAVEGMAGGTLTSEEVAALRVLPPVSSEGIKNILFYALGVTSGFASLPLMFAMLRTWSLFVQACLAFAVGLAFFLFVLKKVLRRERDYGVPEGPDQVTEDDFIGAPEEETQSGSFWSEELAALRWVLASAVLTVVLVIAQWFVNILVHIGIP